MSIDNTTSDIEGLLAEFSEVRAELHALRDTVSQQEAELLALRSAPTRAAVAPTTRATLEALTDEKTKPVVSRRALFGLGAAGVAGAALVGSASPAAAADTDNVVQGADNTADTNTSLSAPDATAPALTVTNTATDAVAIGGPGNAIRGDITANTNGAHAVLGVTAGAGHAVAGVIGTPTSDFAVDFPEGTNAATWGRHYGPAAAVEGQQLAKNVAIGGVANAVKGRIDDPTNGSHSVLGVTNGAGHAVAGVIGTPTSDFDVDFPQGTNAATWGRHYGPAAAIEGQQLAKDIPIAGPANAVKGRIDEPTNGSHSVLGTTKGFGHAVAGEVGTAADPASAGNNTVAATWGRHWGLGAGAEGDNRSTGPGVLGISTGGYGVVATGGLAQLRLTPTAGPGSPTVGDHLLGEFYVDSLGDLYLCTVAGTPGTWTKLNGAAATGGDTGFQYLDVPERIFDSRFEALGKFANNETRVIDLLAGTMVPNGITSALVTLTVTGTTAPRGFASLFRGDQTVAGLPTFSTINWTGAEQNVANTTAINVAGGTVKVFVSMATHVVVDVIAYTGGAAAS